MTDTSKVTAPFMEQLGRDDAATVFDRYFSGHSFDKALDLAFEAAEAAAKRLAEEAGVSLFHRVAYLKAFKEEIKRRVEIAHNEEGRE